MGIGLKRFAVESDWRNETLRTNLWFIPAIESAHALAHGFKRARALAADRIVVINLSGRGDKDVQQVAKLLGKGG